MIEFSKNGSRVFTDKNNRPEFEFKFINSKNIEQVEQELKKLGIELEAKK